MKMWVYLSRIEGSPPNIPIFPFLTCQKPLYLGHFLTCITSTKIKIHTFIPTFVSFPILIMVDFIICLLYNSPSEKYQFNMTS